jgi:hypothetical protein
MKSIFRLLTLAICLELILAPVAPQLVIMSFQQAEASGCPTGLTFDKNLGRCLTSSQAANIVNATRGCSEKSTQEERGACYRKNAEEAMEKENLREINDFFGGKTGSGKFAKGMNAAAISLPLVLGAYMLSRAKLQGAKCKSASLWAMMGAGAALFAGEMLSNHIHSKKLEELKKEWGNIVSPAAMSETNKDRQRANATEAQGKAFEMLAENEKSMSKAARTKSALNAVATLAFATSAFISMKEHLLLKKKKALAIAAKAKPSPESPTIIADYNTTQAKLHCVVNKRPDLIPARNGGANSSGFLQLPTANSLSGRIASIRDNNLRLAPNMASFMVLSQDEGTSLSSPSIEAYEEYSELFAESSVDENPAVLALMKKVVLELMRGLMPITEAMAQDSLENNRLTEEDRRRVAFLEAAQNHLVLIEKEQNQSGMKYVMQQRGVIHGIAELLMPSACAQTPITQQSHCVYGGWIRPGANNQCNRDVATTSCNGSASNFQCPPIFGGQCIPFGSANGLTSRCHTAFNEKYPTPEQKAQFARENQPALSEFRGNVDILCPSSGARGPGQVDGCEGLRRHSQALPGSERVPIEPLAPSLARIPPNALANVGGELRIPQILPPTQEIQTLNDFTRYVHSPFTRFSMATLFGGWAGFMTWHAHSQSNITRDRAEQLIRLKDKFTETSHAVNLCSASDRQNPGKPQCFCYTPDNKRDPAKMESSTVCQRFFNANRNFQEGNYMEGSRLSACVAGNGRIDASCNCRQNNNCLKATLPSMQGFDPGSFSLANNGLSPIDDIGNGNFDAGKINVDRALGNAMKMMGEVKKLEKHKDAQDLVAAQAKESAGLSNLLTQAARHMPGGSAGSMASGSSPIGNMSPAQAVAALESELAKKSDSAAGAEMNIGDGGAGSPSDQLDLGFNDQVGAPDTLAEVMDKNLDYGQNDISAGSGSIFDVLTNRYQRSAMRRLFGGEGKVEADGPELSDLNR